MGSVGLRSATEELDELVLGSCICPQLVTSTIKVADCDMLAFWLGKLVRADSADEKLS